MKRSAVALLALGLSLPAWAFVFESGPDELIFPPQSVPLVFDHALHVREADEAKQLAGADVGCEHCHQNVADSKAASDVDVPGHEVCEECHDDWLAPELGNTTCARCHAADTSSIAPSVVIPAPRIVFSHATHVQTASVACEDCHRRVPTRAMASRDDYPTMDRCISCHEDRGVPTACGTCHLTRSDGRLLTSFPEDQLRPRRFFGFAIHDRAFATDHEDAARRDRTFCSSCHTESDCLSCHDGLGRDVRYHPGDWVALHGIRAKHDDPSCQSCHRLQGFCLNCHIRSGVATVTSVATLEVTRRTGRVGASGRPIGPHPMEEDGWLEPRSRNFHGFAVQRNARSCVSCHQEQWCIQCHGSGARGGSRGGNPHGPNPERLRGSVASKQNARMCLKCHSPVDDAWR
ncbi:MAG: cytochrome c3 family protein [Deltaproteobacteria bacterium]|nr:cytochrome c3 family protein [Deltaproteobacteria bacterium]